MITTSSTVVGRAFPLTFHATSESLVVRATVMKVDTGAQTSVNLAYASTLSQAPSYVYVGEFTPSTTGWYVVQYQADTAEGQTVFTTVSRFHVDQASTASGSGSSTGAASTSGEDGSSLGVPVILDGTSGTLTFTVGRG